MSSPGLKRPSDNFDGKLEMNSVCGPVATVNGFRTVEQNNKRRMVDYHSQNNSSPFDNPSKLLNSLSDHISKFIQDEYSKTTPTLTVGTASQTPPITTSDVCNGNTSSNNNNNNSFDDTPVFSLRQTQMICERLVKDIEQKIRQEYEHKFTNTLAQTTTNIALNLQQQAAAVAALQAQQPQPHHHHHLQHQPQQPHPLLHPQHPQQFTSAPNQNTNPSAVGSTVVPSTGVPLNVSGILSGPVLLVSNIDEQLATPENLFTLFGVFGDVVRVKILFNKKDNALIQMADSNQAQMAIGYLDKQKIFGKPIRVTRSKHQLVQMPRDGNQSDAGLTKDFTNSPLHRFKFPGSRNYLNIYPPSTTLHISNIPATIEENDILNAFEEVCQFKSTSFKFFPKDRKMALMKFDSIEHATIALIRMHNYQISEGVNLRVSYSKSIMQQ